MNLRDLSNENLIKWFWDLFTSKELLSRIRWNSFSNVERSKRFAAKHWFRLTVWYIRIVSIFLLNSILSKNINVIPVLTQRLAQNFITESHIIYYMWIKLNQIPFTLNYDIISFVALTYTYTYTLFSKII